MVQSKLAAYSKQLKLRIPYVTGEVIGINFSSERLAAARENVMLAPHW
jgi:hypothetical protein